MNSSTEPNKQLDESIARKVLSTVDAGLVAGLGNRVVPMALEAAARVAREPQAQALKDAAERCRRDGTVDSVRAAREVARQARAAAYAAAYAYAADAAAAYADADADADADAAYAADARDEVLNVTADVGLQALKDLKSPGCEYLYLLDGAAS